jgi:hypothetical protein
MTDTQSFLFAVSITMLCAIGCTQIVDNVKRYYSEPIILACAITVKGSDGNKHQYIGQGEVWQ